jgi:glycosyltransferase involved in cell wall biosynthesis
MRSQRESGSANVAIIMPAFNRQAFIAEAIDSVLNQTYSNWKLIIVDDGSNDNTLNIARSYTEKDQRIEIIERKHGGISAARNCGILHTDLETEFITFLDSDDIWERELLETLPHAILAEQSCVGAHAVARAFNHNAESGHFDNAKTWPSVRKNIKGLFPNELPDNSPTDFSTLAYGCFVPAGALLIRRWVFDKIRLFDQEATIYSGWDMWLRISIIGPFTFVNKALSRRRIHPGNLSSSKKSSLLRRNVCLNAFMKQRTFQQNKEKC